MAYKDKDKQRKYQRNWVRQKRGSTRQGSTDVIPKVEPNVIPCNTQTVMPKDMGKAIIAQVAKRQIENKYGTVANAITNLCGDKPKPQSHNPMMVGYVPPGRGV